MTADTDLDRSLNRWADSEEYRRRTTGLGTTKQGQAVARKFCQELADNISHDRAIGRDKEVWRALRTIGDDALALRLLVAGISVADSDNLGVDRDEREKNYRDIALWIGRNFGHTHERGLKIGAWGINRLLALPIFGLDGDEILKLTASADELMDGVIERGFTSNPLISPLTEPPLNWTQVRRGGLPADHWAKVPLVRQHHPSVEAAVRKAIATRKMQGVLDAINSLQRVPFCINAPVLDFILKEQPPAPEEKPPFWKKKEFEEWQRSVAELKAFHVDTIAATSMDKAGRFWVPLNIDFRGRIYPIPHFNFQREDRVRALFLFADGEKIGEEGLSWLKAHVAATANGNPWSRVKRPAELGFAERVAWTDENIDTLRSVGDAVLRGDDPAKIQWLLPGDKYQFIAACVELAQALKIGPDFITRLPLTFDGSCSGLQHLCAMTRAEEGRFVNLTAADEGDDFYSRVAFRVSRILKSSPESSHQIVADLLRDPFDRDIVKQPSMSYFYGSDPGGFAKDRSGRLHPYGMTKQIIGVLKDRKKPLAGAKTVAHAIYSAIEDMVPRAKQVRDWLGDLAALCASNGTHLRWTTPLGLPVINCYHEPLYKPISVYVNGRRRRVKLAVGDKESVWKSKAKNSAPANFVHSVDAAHLHLVALAAAKEGIHLATIHDCFGCVASRAVRLNQIIREQFVYLHKRHNLLAGVWAAAKQSLPRRATIPPIPEIGELEIEEVLRSFHAFK